MKRTIFTILFAGLVTISFAQDNSRSSKKSSSRPKQSGTVQQNDQRVSTGARTSTGAQESTTAPNTTVRTKKSNVKVKGPRNQGK